MSLEEYITENNKKHTENKKEFVQELGFLLNKYSRETVEKIDFVEENYTEFAKVIFENGQEQKININHDSVLASMMDIARNLM